MRIMLKIQKNLETAKKATKCNISIQTLKIRLNTVAGSAVNSFSITTILECRDVGSVSNFSVDLVQELKDLT